MARAKAKNITRNCTWRDTVLQKSDLPLKAQKVIDLLEIDIDKITILLLEADPNGKYFKDFGDDKIRGQFEKSSRTIYLINKVSVGVTIHELTHVYLHDYDIDAQVIAEDYMEKVRADNGSGSSHKVIQFGSYYGISSYSNGKYNETVCEIVAMYGRRGQFDKIDELLFEDEEK